MQLTFARGFRPLLKRAVKRYHISRILRRDEIQCPKVGTNESLVYTGVFNNVATRM